MREAELNLSLSLSLSLWVDLTSNSFLEVTLATMYQVIVASGWGEEAHNVTGQRNSDCHRAASLSSRHILQTPR